MVWKETQPGLWSDELDGAEKVFYGMAQAFKTFGKEHGSVYSVCKISTKSNIPGAVSVEKLLLNAWKSLRMDFPSLDVYVENSVKTYQVATPDRVELWAKETFRISQAPSSEDIVPELHQRKLPCLIYVPQSSEVIFHCSHWRIDALGTCMVLDRFFERVARGKVDAPEPQYGAECPKLSPSLEDAYGSPTVSTEEMESVAEAIRRRNFDTSYPTAGLPYAGDMATGPTVSRPHAVELTEEATQALISACKSKGISVTAAVHAACSEAVFERSRSSNDDDYSTVVSANMRDHLPLPYSTKEYACATYVTGITHTVRRSSNFAARSEQLTKAYRKSWDVNGYMEALRPIYQVHGETLKATASSRIRDPVSNVTISSLGVVDKHLRHDHGSIMIESFRLGSAIMTRQMTLYIWTFRGRLALSLDCNEAYYSTASVKAVLCSMVKCLEEELHLVLVKGWS